MPLEYKIFDWVADLCTASILFALWLVVMDFITVTMQLKIHHIPHDASSKDSYRCQLFWNLPCTKFAEVDGE
jgi:hypothetical protein